MGNCLKRYLFTFSTKPTHSTFNESLLPLTSLKAALSLSRPSTSSPTLSLSPSTPASSGGAERRRDTKVNQASLRSGVTGFDDDDNFRESNLGHKLDDPASLPAVGSAKEPANDGEEDKNKVDSVLALLDGTKPEDLGSKAEEGRDNEEP
ncbi:hypothetical protein NL676_032459 [Syzygium grande]|nr:hypothetical protein NL676_032459 [Syzygium grande]